MYIFNYIFWDAYNYLPTIYFAGDTSKFSPALIFYQLICFNIGTVHYTVLNIWTYEIIVMHTLYKYPDVRSMPIFSHYLNVQVGKQAHQHQICISPVIFSFLLLFSKKSVIRIYCHMHGWLYLHTQARIWQLSHSQKQKRHATDIS